MGSVALGNFTVSLSRWGDTALRFETTVTITNVFDVVDRKGGGDEVE